MRHVSVTRVKPWKDFTSAAAAVMEAPAPTGLTPAAAALIDTIEGSVTTGLPEPSLVDSLKAVLEACACGTTVEHPALESKTYGIDHQRTKKTKGRIDGETTEPTRR